MKVSRDLRHGLMLSAAAYLAFAGGYAYHVISSRWLGPADYSVVGATGSVFNMVILLFGAVEMASSRALAAGQGMTLSGGGWPSARAWRTAMLAFGAATTILLVLIAGPLSASLHLVSAAPILIVAVGVPLVSLATWQRVLYRSRNAFEVISQRIVLEKAFAIAAVVVALVLGLGVSGVIAATGASSLVWLRRSSRSSGMGVSRSRILSDLIQIGRDRSAGSMILSYLILGIVANLDVLVVQAKHPGIVAGQYAVVALFGRGLFLGVLTLAGALIPKVAASSHPPDAYKLLGQYVALSLVAAGIATVVATRFGAVLLPLVFGAAFAAAAPLLTLQMTFAALSGLRGLLISYAQARCLPGALIGQLVSAALTSLMLVSSGEIEAMLRAAIVAQVVCLIGYGSWLLVQESARRPAPPLGTSSGRNDVDDPGHCADLQRSDQPPLSRGRPFGSSGAVVTSGGR